MPAWPNQSAGKDLLEALEAPEFETLKKYQEKLANWSAVTTTRNNGQFSPGSLETVFLD